LRVTGGADPVPPGGGGLGLARDEFANEPLRFAGQPARLRRHTRAQWRDRAQREPVDLWPRRANHVRSGGQVTEPLRLRAEDYDQYPKAVERRQKIDEPEQVADENGSELRGRTILVDNAQAERALA